MPPALTFLGFAATILLLLPATHGQNCGTTGTGSQFTATAQAGALAYHNAMRYNVSIGTYQANGTILGPALSMPNMTWNCTLAAEAQNWANGCAFQHDPNHAYFGENLYAGLASTAQALPTFYPPDQLGYIASYNWQTEFQTNVITTLVTGQYSAMLGHATQMIWSTSTQLGCGYATNCPYNNSQLPYMTLVVCRYIGPGNYVGQQPYTVNCPAGKTVSSNNLTCAGSSGGTTATTAKPTTATTAPSPTTATPASCYGGFSTSGAQAILNAHNTIRTQVRLGTYQANGTTLGPANGLGNLTWSCSLGASALQYAQQNCPNMPSTVPAGTLAIAGSAPQNVNGQPYFDQVLPADGTGITAFNAFVAPLKNKVVTTLTVGNANAAPFLTATQVLWANTATFGCGTYVCPTGVNSTQYGPYETRFVACQYSPIGNYNGQQPFAVTCPSGKSVTANGLTCA